MSLHKLKLIFYCKLPLPLNSLASSKVEPLRFSLLEPEPSPVGPAVTVCSSLDCAGCEVVLLLAPPLLFPVLFVLVVLGFVVVEVDTCVSFKYFDDTKEPFDN